MQPLREKILKELNREDALLHRLWDRWQKLSSEKLHYLPSDEGWSLMQAGAHLCQAERLALIYIEKKSNSEHLKTGNFNSIARLQLMKWILLLPIKLKAPKVVSIPPHYDTLAQMLNDWRSTREGLKIFIEQLEEEKLNKAFFKHPTAGMLTPLGMVRFFQFHLHHHMRQFERIETKLSQL